MKKLLLSFPVVVDNLDEPNSPTENLSFLLSVLFIIGTATYIITRLINGNPLKLWEKIILIIVAIAAVIWFAAWLILPTGGIGFA
jgi:hypothetical protein